MGRRAAGSFFALDVLGIKITQPHFGYSHCSTDSVSCYSVIRSEVYSQCNKHKRKT